MIRAANFSPCLYNPQIQQILASLTPNLRHIMFVQANGLSKFGALRLPLASAKRLSGYPHQLGPVRATIGLVTRCRLVIGTILLGCAVALRAVHIAQHPASHCIAVSGRVYPIAALPCVVG
jgi:hypothetical protein